MNATVAGGLRLATITLFTVVVTQAIYVGFGGLGIEVDSSVLWTVEAVAFTLMALAALVAVPVGGAAGWAAAGIAAGALLNVVQVGMGLAMFGPLRDAGEALAPVFTAVLAGAFFLYFAGKFAFGVAGLVLGASLLTGAGGGFAKGAGALAALTGLAALAVNTAAMAIGMDITFAAGAAGTVATAFLGLALIAAARLPQLP